MASFPTTSLQSVIAVLAGLGTIVQLIVLTVLLVASIICWSIIVHKARQFRQARRHSARFRQAIGTTDDLAFMAAAARRFAKSPLARLFRVVHQRVAGGDQGRRARGEEDPSGMARLHHLLRQTQAEEVGRLEDGLPFLATTASAAPFVGLFGTVWGIMQSFHAVGQRGGASLAIVGPGISEALIATAAGLAAAIPAVVAYNHYVNRLRRLEGELEAFSEELALLFDHRLPHDIQRVGTRPPMPH